MEKELSSLFPYFFSILSYSLFIFFFLPLYLPFLRINSLIFFILLSFFILFRFLPFLFLIVLLRFSYSISSFTSYSFESFCFSLSSFPPPSSLPNPLAPHPLHHSSLSSLSLPRRPRCASISYFLPYFSASSFSFCFFFLPSFFPPPLPAPSLPLPSFTSSLLRRCILSTTASAANICCLTILMSVGISGKQSSNPRLLANCRPLRVFISAVNPVPATE